MTSIVQLHCDLCGAPLKENELKSGGFIQIGNKPKAKSSIKLEFDGAVKQGELCFKCGKEFRDYIETKKMEANK